MLFGPVWNVALIKNCLVAADPHHSFLRNLRFKVGFSEETHPKSVLDFSLHIDQRVADGAVVQVIVKVYQVLDDAHPTNGAAFRQICLYFGHDAAVKSLHYGRLVLAITGKDLNTVELHQGLKVRVKELLAFDGL